MLRVPSFVKTVFETFPLKTNPAIPNTTPASRKAIEDNRYYLEFDPENTSLEDAEEAYFVLGVHNVLELQSEHSDAHRFIPSDPISLAQCLMLCHKNKLKLPTSGSQKSKNASPHSLLALAHHASPDGQLPILIETNRDASRTIRSSKFINDSLNSKFFSDDAQASLINNMLDHDLSDLWILSVLVEVSQQKFDLLTTIFKFDDALAQNNYLLTASCIALLQELPTWNAFKVRTPSLFDTKKSSSIKHPIRYWQEPGLEFHVIDNPTALYKYYEDQLSKLELTLDLMIDYVSSQSSTAPAKAIELKLIAFVIYVDHVLGSDTKLGEIIAQPKFESLVKHAYEVVFTHF